MSIFEGNRQDVTYDGKDLSMWYDLYVVYLDANKENIFGVKKTITYNNNTFVKTDSERYVIDVTFAKIKNGIPMDIPEDDLDELILLFFRKDEPVIMDIDCKLYYVVPVDGTIRKTKNKYFTISLESVSPYSYSIPGKDKKVVSNTIKDFMISNIGITDIYLDLEMEGVAEKVVIRNRTNGNFIEIANLKQGESVHIIGDTLEVLGIGYSRVTGSIKDTLKLKYGTNRFSIEVVGDVTCIFTHQLELGLV